MWYVDELSLSLLHCVCTRVFVSFVFFAFILACLFLVKRENPPPVLFSIRKFNIRLDTPSLPHKSSGARRRSQSQQRCVWERDGLGEHVWGGRRTSFPEFCSPIMDSKSNRHKTMQRLSWSEHHSLIVYTDDMRTRSLCRVWKGKSAVLSLSYDHSPKKTEYWDFKLAREDSQKRNNRVAE